MMAAQMLVKIWAGLEESFAAPSTIYGIEMSEAIEKWCPLNKFINIDAISTLSLGSTHFEVIKFNVPKW